MIATDMEKETLQHGLDLLKWIQDNPDDDTMWEKIEKTILEFEAVIRQYDETE